MAGNNECMSTPERRILGELGNSDPISPTANLRLLTTLASNLKNVPETPRSALLNINDTIQDSSVVQGSGGLKLLPRKEKSLSLLCNKFLNLFPLNIQDVNQPKEISLNTTAKALGTEKRRIYDIINVLESLEMASKAGKNQYYWHGQSRLPQTLAKLKVSAIEMGLKNKIQEIQKINRAYIEDSGINSNSSSLMVPQSPVVNFSFEDSNIKEDKSLSVMCRKFVMLFLVSLENGVINLDIAAKVLINEQDSSSEVKSSTLSSRYKTKVRRLYDIANVLSAIGLIEKVDLYNCIIRKPIFKYTGPKVDSVNFDKNTGATASIENESQSLVGMTTPNKKKCFSFRVLSRFSKLCSGGSTTPVSSNRQAKKRKLFETGQTTKFERAQSSPCLSSSKIQALDDSILQVAEMELKRMKSELKSKVCTKLFPRHNSDSCILPTDINMEKTNMNVTSTVTNQSNSMSSSPLMLPIISRENLVKEMNSGQSPIHTVRINVPVDIKFTPMHTVQQNIDKTPKFINLKNLNLKKLVPISQNEILQLSNYSNPTTQSEIIHLPNYSNPTTPTTSNTDKKTDVTYLTPIPIKQISPGDTFKAIKVGNTFQLVPFQSYMGDNSSKQK